MAVDLGTAFVQIQASARGITSNLQRELGDPLSQAADRAGSESATRFGSRFRSGIGTAMRASGVALGAALVGAVAVGRDAISAASDLEETQSKVNTVFGEGADIVNRWAADAAGAIGQSRQQALDAAGSFGNMFTQLGIGSEAAAGMSVEMTNLASDFASFHNADITEVLTAQQAAFRGEYDAVQRFVPTINAAAVEQKALEMGLAATTGELDAQDRALATQALLLEGAGAAAGDFQRTSGSLANQQRILSARWDNAKAALGRGLLPVVTRVTSWLAERFLPAVQRLAAVWMPQLSSWFSVVAATVATAWPTVVDVFQAVFDGLRTGITFLFDNEAILIGIFAAVAAGFGMWAVSAASAAAATLAATAPFIIVGAAVAALVAGIVYAYQNWEWFRGVVDAVADAAVAAWGWMSTAAQALWDKTSGLRSFIADAFVAAWAAAETIVGAVKVAFDNARTAAQLVWDKTSGFRSFLVGAFAAAGLLAVGVVNGVRTAFDTARNSAGWMWDKTEGLRSFLVGAFLVGAGVAVAIVGAVRTAFDKATNSAGWLWDKTKGLRSFLAGSFVGGVAVGIAVINAAKSAFGAARDAVQWVIDKVSALIGWLGKIRWPSPPNWLGGNGTQDLIDRVMNVDGARATGGPVQAGGLYKVGERGWEYFRPAQDGYVYSHADSRRMTGSGRSVNVVVNNHRSVAGPAEIARGLALAGVT